jgi:hypothetical protein
VLVILGPGCGAGQPPAAAEPAAAAPVAAEPVASAAPAAPAASSSAAPAEPDRDLNDIAKTVSSKRDVFRACYDKSAKVHPGVEGKFVLHFVIKPDGTVKSVDVDLQKSQIRAEDMINCAIQAGRGLKFAPSAKGMESVANYPFDFHPKAAK